MKPLVSFFAILFLFGCAQEEEVIGNVRREIQLDYPGQEVADLRCTLGQGSIKWECEGAVKGRVVGYTCTSGILGVCCRPTDLGPSDRACREGGLLGYDCTSGILGICCDPHN